MDVQSTTSMKTLRLDTPLSRESISSETLELFNHSVNKLYAPKKGVMTCSSTTPPTAVMVPTYVPLLVHTINMPTVNGKPTISHKNRTQHGKVTTTTITTMEYPSISLVPY